MINAGNDIARTIAASDISQSKYLEEALLLVKDGNTDENVFEKITQLSMQAPYEEHETFGDLMSNLFLKSENI